MKAGSLRLISKPGVNLTFRGLLKGISYQSERCHLQSLTIIALGKITESPLRSYCRLIPSAELPHPAEPKTFTPMSHMTQQARMLFNPPAKSLSASPINRESVEVCLELHADEPTEETSQMCVDSVGMGLRQLAYLLMPLQLLALDLETAAARQVS